MVLDRNRVAHLDDKEEGGEAAAGEGAVVSRPRALKRSFISLPCTSSARRHVAPPSVGCIGDDRDMD